jgi:hypothetical protein
MMNGGGDEKFLKQIANQLPPGKRAEFIQQVERDNPQLAAVLRGEIRTGASTHAGMLAR